ncbi:MAG: tetratricopeptide repeat protein [Rhodospirillales bacterium]|nr:tetratricopeptide repeat protein [Rhodospirillales bacterium]MBO6788747.1 tetratricopeptide repeat protein [Rhodospirillales bacterium]
MLACATLSVISISGCGGEVPTQAEIKQDNIDSRAAQLVRVGDTTREAGDYANAMQLYQRAAGMRPDWAPPLLRFGETAISAGLYADALGAYERVAKIDPTSNRGYNGAGIALDLLGRHEEAQNYYITGIERAPDNVPLKNNLGLSLALTGEYGDAIGMLEGIAGSPNANARTRQNLSLVYGLAGDDENAKRIGMMDLGEAEVANNLAFYARLREMTPEDRAKAVFGVLQ